MLALNVVRSGETGALEIVPAEARPLAPREVRVRTLAAALNYRDLALMRGASFGAAADRYVPLSDACGVVEELGSAVTAWQVGDVVCSLFFPDWLGGEATPAALAALGASERGVGQQYFVAGEHSLIAAPAHLDAFDAATLPCAALTAWNAVTGWRLVPGQTVLLQGTGGVSLFALAFAKAVGARVIMTSSSDDKLERARKMGADMLINYKRESRWAAAARDLTGGTGVDLVVEVGGAGTFAQSLEAIRLGGAISVVGMLAGRSEALDIRNIYGRQARIRGITVGSKADFARMNRAMEQHAIKPVIAERIGWREAGAAFEKLAGAGHFGKILLDFRDREEA